TYSNYGIYTVSLIATGPLGTDSIIAQSLIDIDPNNPCIITLPASGGGITQTGCNGTLYDVGGPNADYYPNSDAWTTIAPIGSNQITINFTMFDLETSTNCIYDYVEIFDGLNTSATSLGQFCNSSPGTIISSGGAITIYLHADGGLEAAGFEMSWNCTYPASSPITSFQVSDTLSCDGTISFTDLSSNGPTYWLWDFGDGNTSNLQNPTHTYSSGGIFTISLTTTNQYGSDSYIETNYINIMNSTLTANSNSACGSSSVALIANSISTNIKWYSDANAITLVGSGNTFNTPILTNSTTYYVRNELNFASVFGGPVDNSFGGGGAFQGNRNLVFDNYSPSTLVSVLVYAYSAGNRTIELRNSSNAILKDTTLYIPYSATSGYRVYLNFDLPVQNNLQLGVNGINTDLFRNDAGSVFPYNISNIISITGTNASAGYYYFFYDWEVEKDPCSSLLIPVEAIIYPVYSATQNIDLCNGGSITVGNNTYTQAGNYTDILTTQNLCDSTIYTNFTVGNSSVINNSVNICSGVSYVVGNSVYTQSGSYSDTLQSGNCDSIVNTNLFVLNQITNNQNFTICQSDSILVNNNYYSVTGVYYDSLISVNGCDSILIINLNISLNQNISNLQSVCIGDSYVINNNVYTQAGTYTDVLQDINGCDSTITTILTLLPVNNLNNNVDICKGDSVVVGVNTYYGEGTFTDTLSNNWGCDSIVTTYIDVSDLMAQLTLNGTDIDATVINGTSPFTYDIYGPTGLLSSFQNNGGIIQFTPLINGTYYLIITDAIGCVSDTSFMYVDFVSTSIFEVINFSEIDKIVDVLGREIPFRKNT
ncbi:MAG: CUB domain-containing protein, partial [Flavobacteriales bacterium]